MTGKARTKTGCLLIHGFGSTPFEMEPLALVLADAGHEVRNILLPGHGTTPQEWNRTTFDDWSEYAQARFIALQAEVDHAFVFGMSMGGSLGLRIAQACNPAGLMTIAAPVFICQLFPPRMKDWRLPLVPLLKRVRPIWPTPPRPQSHRDIAPWQGYEEHMAMHALDSFMKGLLPVRRGLGRITCPLLAVHAPDDRTTPPDNAWEIARRVSSEYRRVALLPIQETQTGHHMLITHRETREVVQNLAVEFVDSILAMKMQRI